MRCEPGTHDYRPFARSRDLFCRYCGDQPNRVVIRQRLPAESDEVEPQQPELPLQAPDPDSAAARAIIERAREARRAQAQQAQSFEEQVTAIVAQAGLDGGLSGELIATAIDFGEELDLDKFAELVASHRPAPPAEDASELI
jgi:hypothetical protein